MFIDHPQNFASLGQQKHRICDIDLQDVGSVVCGEKDMATIAIVADIVDPANGIEVTVATSRNCFSYWIVFIDFKLLIKDCFLFEY